MKKVREKDVRFLESFCAITALAAGILCILFLFDVLQNHWFLNFILGLGCLLHVAAALLYLMQRRTVLTVVSALLMVFYVASLIYFNI